MHCFVEDIDPEIPWIGVDVGVRCKDFVPSSHDSSLKMWRLSPESRMQRGGDMSKCCDGVDVYIISRTTFESIFGLEDWSVVGNFIFFLVVFLRVL